jgi:hypothetical protein
LLFIFGLKTSFPLIGIRDGSASLVVALAAVHRPLDIAAKGRRIEVIE